MDKKLEISRVLVGYGVEDLDAVDAAEAFLKVVGVRTTLEDAEGWVKRLAPEVGDDVREKCAKRLLEVSLGEG